MHLTSAALQNRDMILGRDEVAILGPDLVLRDCRITIATTAKNLVVAGVTFEKSRIKARGTLRNFKWCEARILGCHIEGTYSGCDFGSWPGFSERPGDIADTDLTEATLEGCRFMNCDVASLRFPRWPSFTIVQPRKVAKGAAWSLPWPGRIQGLMEVIADSPGGTVAVSEFAPAVIERRGGSESGS